MKFTNGIFEDFIGIWDNSVDENICKEFIKYQINEMFLSVALLSEYVQRFS